MKVLVCDCCGKQYRPYVTKNNGDELGVENANGITFVYVDKMNKISGRGKAELCPECMDKLQCFVFDELCNEDAPFIGKIRYYQQRKKNIVENKEKEE